MAAACVDWASWRISKPSHAGLRSVSCAAANRKVPPEGGALQPAGGARGPCAGQTRRRSGTAGWTPRGVALSGIGAVRNVAGSMIAITVPPESAPSAFRFCKGADVETDLALLGLSTTETLAGSKAEPTKRERGCPPEGAAESSTTTSITQPHRKNLPVSLRPSLWCVSVITDRFERKRWRMQGRCGKWIGFASEGDERKLLRESGRPILSAREEGL